MIEEDANPAGVLLPFYICSTVGEAEGKMYIFLLSKDIHGCVEGLGKLPLFCCDPVSHQCTLDSLAILLSVTPELRWTENGPFICWGNG